MGDLVLFLSGQLKGGPPVAGFHCQRFRGKEKWCFLFGRKLALHGFRHDLLDIHAIGPGQSNFPRDERGQLFGFAVSGREGECVWGEVYERLIVTIKLEFNLQPHCQR